MLYLFENVSFTDQIEIPGGFDRNDKNMETMNEEAAGQNEIPLNKNLDPSISFSRAKQVSIQI